MHEKIASCFSLSLKDSIREHSVLHCITRMAKHTMSVRIDSGTREALDSIAAGLDRDRSYVVKAALDAFVEMHRWQIDHIEQGLREAEAGEFVPEIEAKQVIDRLRRR
jgi:predicted transcriptional regulator